MKASLLTIACLVFAALLISTPQAAWSKNTNKTQKEKGKSEKAIELKGTKGAATRGSEADPNIKSDKQTNDPNAEIEAPSQKGGATTRGGGNCEVRLDNRTSLFIKVYVDGAYRGTLSPYGDGVVFVLPGETHVYARADFDDGTYYYWGPSAYACGAGQYIYFKMVR
jgi:hypothetical protein